MLTLQELHTLSRLLDDALALAPQQRAAWLAALPPEASHLQGALQQMLDREAGLLEDGLLRTLPKLGGWAGEEAGSVRAGDLVGPYRLLQQIGHGGMGSVWRAERADGSYQREVALKLPRLTWGEGLARLMAQERDIGAMLEHPNIARLYDAGIDARGWPYLALELVTGQPIDAWCREHGASVPDRLGLLLQVMHAVRYAHGRLVVHRDIKPSNVLVTADGQARLLDFGIAKLLSDTGDGLTEEGARRLTPHYASPEQLRGDPVTVATDVYSLGVLAFELLTGQTPYRLAGPSRAAWEAAVLADEPELASTRCQDRATARALRGDLDAILALALRRDPAARYASVDALAQDLERHLRGDAVLAQPDRAWHRLRRSLRRHRLAVSTASIVLAALAVGGGLALRQHQQAELAAQRQHLVTRFVATLLRADQSAFHARTDARFPTAELTLSESAALIESRFQDEPMLQAELLGAVARQFMDMDRPALAAAQANRQCQALERAGAPATARAAARLLSAQGWLADGQWTDAEAAAREALALAGRNAPLQAEALACQAQAAWWGGHAEAAATPLAALQALLPGLPADAQARARWQALQADMALRAGRFDDADTHFARAIALADANDPTYARRLRLQLARHLIDRGRVEAARPWAQAAAQDLRRQGGEAAIEARVVDAEFALAAYRHRLLPHADAVQAVDAAQALIDAQPAVPKGLAVRTGYLRGELALRHGDVQTSLRTLVGLGDPPSTGPLPRELQNLATERLWSDVSLMTGGSFARDIGAWMGTTRARLGMVGHPDTAADTLRAALTLAWDGDARTALTLLDGTPAVTGTDAPAETARAQLAWLRAQLLLELGQVDAAADAVRALPLVAVPDVSEDLFSATAVAARLDCAQGRAGTGRARLTAEAEALLHDRHPATPRAAWLRAHAGLCALAAGDRGGALALAAQAREAFRRQPAVAAYYKQPLMQLERALRGH